jgi:copper chaperone CopZ
MTTTANAIETITLNVAGMTCGSCERHIQKELDQVGGFRNAEVDLAQGQVIVVYDASAARPEQLVEAVTRAGYPAEIAVAEGVKPSGTKSCSCCAPKPLS